MNIKLLKEKIINDKNKEVFKLFIEELTYGPVGISSGFIVGIVFLILVSWLLCTYTMIIKVAFCMFCICVSLVSLYFFGKYIYDLWKKCVRIVEYKEKQ